MNKKKCIFFDRDNTLIYDRGYTYKKKDLKWKKKAKKVIKLAKGLSFLVIVITNQSGVAKGFFTEKKVKEFHNYMNKDLKKVKTFIDDFFYCPYHIDGFGKYKKIQLIENQIMGCLRKLSKNGISILKKVILLGIKLLTTKHQKKPKLDLLKERL